MSVPAGEHIRAVRQAHRDGYEAGYIAGLKEAEKLTGIGLASVVAAVEARFQRARRNASDEGQNGDSEVNSGHKKTAPAVAPTTVPRGLTPSREGLIT